MYDYLEMLTLALIPGFLLLDLLIQKRNYHKTRHWRLRGLHRYNYADLPVIDMLFGTFRNAGKSVDLECGFYNGASRRIAEMLIGKDVSTPGRQGAADGRWQPGVPVDL